MPFNKNVNVLFSLTSIMTGFLLLLVFCYSTYYQGIPCSVKVKRLKLHTQGPLYLLVPFGVLYFS